MPEYKKVDYSADCFDAAPFQEILFEFHVKT